MPYLGLLVGPLLTAPLIGLLYLANQAAGLPFVPFDLFNWLVRRLPGALVTWAIDALTYSLPRLGADVADSAKPVEQGLAVLLFLIVGTAIATAFFAGLDRLPRRLAGRQASRWAMPIAGLVFGLPLIALCLNAGRFTAPPLASLAWLAALFLAWGSALGWIHRRLTLTEFSSLSTGATSTVEVLNRRQLLVRLGATTATLTLVGAGLGTAFALNQRRRIATDLEAALVESGRYSTTRGDGTPLPNHDDPLLPAPGTRPEYTPLKDHYKVFIDTWPIAIDEHEWSLSVSGLVDKPLTLTLDALRHNYPAEERYITLRCISGRVGDRLISTTLWTGCRLKDVLAEAGVQPQARYLHITSADGYYETLDLDLVDRDERILLCYAMDGRPLRVFHGFPLRIWIPDVYGMKQPKWIVGLEATETYQPGYWVERGWDETAQVKATSAIDTVAVKATFQRGGQRFVPVGGMAYAGARGISRVEVRVDGGPWQEAALRKPLAQTTWVIWRYDWPFAAGDHSFEVRCFEQDGTPQLEAVQPPHPDGASGLHRSQAHL